MVGRDHRISRKRYKMRIRTTARRPRKIILKFTASQRARLELQALANDPALVSNYMLGVPMTAEMKQENERRESEFRRRKLAIIQKYGVAKEYLKPLLEVEVRLKVELSAVQQEISDLRAIQVK